MAFSFNAGWMQPRNITIAKIPRLNIKYSVNTNLTCAYLSIPGQNDKKKQIKIFKRESSYDKQEYFSLLHHAMFLGMYWDDVLQWMTQINIGRYFQDDKEGIQMTSYGDIVFNMNAYEQCYQGWGDYSKLQMYRNNEVDINLMIKYFLAQFEIHLADDRIQAFIYKYKLSSLTCDDALKYSLFISKNQLHSDCFDLFANDDSSSKFWIKNSIISTETLSYDLFLLLIHGYTRKYVSENSLLVTVTRMLQIVLWNDRHYLGAIPYYQVSNEITSGIIYIECKDDNKCARMNSYKIFRYSCHYHSIDGLYTITNSGYNS